MRGVLLLFLLCVFGVFPLEGAVWPVKIGR